MPKQLVSLSTITGWRGLNERRLLDGPPVETSSLNNVFIKNGVVTGRKGINELADDTTSAIGTTPVIGQWEFIRSTSNSSTLLRMTRTKVEKFNGTTWDDVTGTALNGLATTRPQAVTHGESDLFCFTNEGLDRPRKYIGTGNTAVLGGTPPYAKAIASYVGFLCLGNVSDDGATFSPLNLVLSDDPDGTWVDCSTQDRFVTTLIMNESPGPILALEVLGRSLYVYKSDAVIRVTFTGGVTRFNRERVPFPMGILAPLSLQKLGELGHIFLAQDRNLYLNTGAAITQLPTTVQKTLRETLSVASAPYVRSAVNPDTDTYRLIYKKDDASYQDGFIDFNYRDGTWTKGEYPVGFNAISSYRSAATAESVFVASSATLTYQLDTGTDDNGTSVSRFFDVDWTDLGLPGTKYLVGGELVFEKARDVRVRVSVAVDKSSKFQYPRTYDLRGRDPDETLVRVAYNIPSPVYGTWFKVRVEFYQDSSTNVGRLVSFTPEIIKMQAASVDNPSLASPSKV